MGHDKDKLQTRLANIIYQFTRDKQLMTEIMIAHDNVPRIRQIVIQNIFGSSRLTAAHLDMVYEASQILEELEGLRT